jgi:imidazolonepropionase
MRDAGLIEQAAVAVRDGRIVAVGPSAEVAARYTADERIDCTGHAVCPGFVDPHTHAVFGGDRVHEFEQRIGGATYMEIMAAGGGIAYTVRHTRAASEEELVALTRKRLDQMLALGTTTVEIKSGYGLDTESELKLLRVAEQLARTHPCAVVPTFLGAHATPPEYRGNTDGYVDLVIHDMLPAVVAWYGGSYFAARRIPFFIDVFCEEHAFDLAQSRRILEAGLRAGLRVKAHVDQFTTCGGVSMALGLEAASVDHLDTTPDAEIQRLAQSATVAVPLPAVTFNLGMTVYADARAMIDAGAAVALATDLNPGSAPCLAMPLVMAIACRYQRLLPAEALNAGTINAAHAVGLGDVAGSIETGKRADLLILKEADYRHIPYFFGGNPVETVIVGGRMKDEG